MCDPVITPWLLAAATTASVASTLKQGDDNAKAAELQGAYAADEAQQTVKNIRRAAKMQVGQANTALASSGVKLGEGTALEVDKAITENAQQDAVSAILSGTRAQSMARMEADASRENSVLSAGAIALQSGAMYASGGWKGTAKGLNNPARNVQGKGVYYDS